MKRMFVGAAAVALTLSFVVLSSPADAADVVGPVTGTITYDGDGIPPMNSDFLTYPDCRETTFDLSLQAVIAVEYGDLSFKGPVTITGNGRSGISDDWRVCESTWQWTGSHGLMFVSLVGTDTGGVTLRCDEMGGHWLRYATEWVAEAFGDCTLGGDVLGNTSLIVAAEWVPTPVGGGVTTDVTGAVLAGAMLLRGPW